LDHILEYVCDPERKYDQSIAQLKQKDKEVDSFLCLKQGKAESKCLHQV